MIDLLNNNWNAANTDQIKPQKIDSIKNVYFLGGADNVGDMVLVNEMNTTQQIIGIGGQPRRTSTLVALTISTTESKAGGGGKAHVIKMLGEADRILTANIKNPDSNYDLIDTDNDWIDLSDKMKRIWKYVYNFRLVKSAETIGV